MSTPLSPLPPSRPQQPALTAAALGSSAAQPADAAPPASVDVVSLDGGASSNTSGSSSTLEKMLSSTTIAAMVGNNMKVGDTLSIGMAGKTVLEVKKEGASALDNVKTLTSKAFHVSAAEVSNVVAQDPSFAFKGAALAVKDQVFNGLSPDLVPLAENGFLPLIRVVALGLDSKRAIETFKNPDATGLDKTVDGAHLVTDLVGLGGAVCFAIPGINPMLAQGLSATGLVGDIASYGYHVMKYFRDRGMVVDPNQGGLTTQA